MVDYCEIKYKRQFFSNLCTDPDHDFLRAAKSASSLQSVESMASYASSMSTNSLYNISQQQDKGGKECDNFDEKPEKVGWYRKYIGIFLTLLSGLLYSLAALLVKLLKDDYHPFMISIWYFDTSI